MAQQHLATGMKARCKQRRRASGRSSKIARRRMMLEQLEYRRLLNADWQNPVNRLDVNNDRFVAPSDVLAIVNELNAAVETRLSGPNGELPVPTEQTSPPPFLDVNGDMFVAPGDALIVINVLNQEFVAPVVTIGLLNDTAPQGTNNDQLTSDPTLGGRVSATSGALKLEVRLDGGPVVEAQLDPSGNFTFDPGLARDGTEDGLHTVTLVATDARNQSSDPQQFSFTLDTLAPAADFDLNPAFDSAVVGDRLTTFASVTIDGQSEPNATVRIENLGIDLTADAGGAFSIQNVALTRGINTFVARIADAAGNVSNQSERFVRSVSADAFALVEGSPFAVEALKTVVIGDSGTPRQIAINLETLLDTAAPRMLLNDVLNVFVVDAMDKSMTLLDNGRPGTPIFSLSESGTNLAAGIATLRGKELLVNVSSVVPSTVQLLFQLVSGDADRNGLVVIDGIRVLTPNAAAQAPLIAALQRDVAPGGAIDLGGLSPVGQLDVQIINPRFASVSGKFKASLLLTNRGAAVGRDLAVVLRNLPAGVTVDGAATTLDGDPVVNLRPATSSGGLKQGQSTRPVELSIDNPANQRFTFDILVLAGPPNRAPELAAIDPVVMHPGQVRRLALDANDPDGDALTFSLVPIAGQPALPSLRMTQTGEITFRPLASQLGSFQFEVRVSDGATTTSKMISLDVTPDPVATTRISGVVLNTDQEPLDGVPVEIAGFSSVTGADGSFTIELPTLKVPTESFSIPVPAGDPMLDPFNTGTQQIPLRRARYDVTTGGTEQDPRQHPNLVTSFIDASMVYGSDDARAGALRTMVDGKLKTSGTAGELLPRNDAATFPDGVLENDNAGRSDPSNLFAAGDVRANENVALLSLHTLLVREHNRLADDIQAANPTLSDEEIYQQARRMVGAIIQHITYSEYLPLLLGENAIPAYTGYKPAVDPGISAIFSTAAFRLGHTQLSTEMLRLDENGDSLPGGPLMLRNAFFTTGPIQDDGIEPYLRGLAVSAAQEIDVQVIDDLRNMLFGPPGAGGSDLAAINIQRGRDLGLPSYNQARIDFDLPRVTTFDEITSDVAVRAALKAAYGAVDKIDAFVGGLAEDHIPGATVGPLFAAIMAEQFTRSRDADRFWYENEQFAAAELQQIRDTSLTSLIERNTTIVGLPANLFTTGTIPSSPPAAGSAASNPPSEVRSADGTGNNPSDTTLGSAGTNLLENFTRQYGDRVGSPGGQDRPNARVISNTVHNHNADTPSSIGLTSMFVFWGQFLDHDITLTPGGVDDALKILGNERPNPNGDEAYPFVAERMPLMLGHDALPGFDNVIDRPIFLPKLDSGTTIDPAQNTTVVAENIANATVFVSANTLRDRSGNAFTGQLSITEVPVDLTPAALPAGLFPDLVVTIQPADLVFTTPAPLTLPNLSSLPAGTEVDLFSINPITGEFDVVGTGRVSSNGSRIETIEGGIRNSSWHFFVRQTPPAQEQANDDPANNSRNQDQLCDDCEGTAKKSGKSVATSDVELHSGALLEQHVLVSYQSLGQQRGVSLHYNSQRADPRPIFHFGAVNVSGDETLVASLDVRRGDLEIQVPGFVGTQFGLRGGEHFWDPPAGTNDVDAALQVDLRDQPTGVYEFNVTFGPRRFNGTRFTGAATQFSTPVAIINSINSPFGAGWDLAGLEQLIENPDGSVMLIDGGGTELQFTPQGPGQPFESPAGDFSTFDRLGDGTYRRTFTDKTVVQFNADNRIASVTDRNNNQTVFAYDADGVITSIVDPVGLTTTFTRTGDRITKITDPAGRETTLDFDTAGDLIRITDPDGISRQFIYDDAHHLTQETNKRGFSETAVYGFHGRVVETVRKDGTRSVFEAAQTIGLLPAELTSNPNTAPAILADSRQAVARFADPNGNVTTTVLDKAGQLQSQTDNEGNLPSVVRNRDNLQVVTSDGRGNGTYRKFDSAAT